MDDSMLDRDFRACLRQPDDHFPANLRRFLDEVGDADGKVIFDRVLNLRVIERVAKTIVLSKILGGSPEPVPSANLPVILIGFAGLVVHQLENASALGGPIGDDARAHSDGDDELGEIVRELQVLFPTSKGRIFSGHTKVILGLITYFANQEQITC